MPKKKYDFIDLALPKNNEASLCIRGINLNECLTKAYAMMDACGLGKDYTAMAYEPSVDQLTACELIASDTATPTINPNFTKITGGQVYGTNSIYKISNEAYLIRGYMTVTRGVDEFGFLMISSKGTRDDINNRLGETLEKLVKMDEDAIEKSSKESRDEAKDALDRIILPEDQKAALISEVEAFINARQSYKDIGLPWKRGIVLYGEPGNGKTSLIRSISKYFELEMVDLTSSVDNEGNPTVKAHNRSMEGLESPIVMFLNHHTIRKLMRPNKVRPTLYYIEDLDKSLPGSSSDSPKMRLSSLLSLLDGVNKLDGALFIATTNKADELSDAIMSRPGRFDSLYEICKPGVKEILALLNYHKMKINGDPVSEEYARNLEGYSMAFVEEYVKIAKMMYKSNDITQEQADSIMKKIQDHNNKYQKHFESEKESIGFAK